MVGDIVYGIYYPCDEDYNIEDYDVQYIEEIGTNTRTKGISLMNKNQLENLWEDVWDVQNIKDWEGNVFTFDYGQDSDLYILTQDGLIPFEKPNYPPHKLMIPFQSRNGHQAALFDWELHVEYKGIWMKDWEYFDIWRYDEGKLLNKPYFYEKVLKK